jgi:cell division transport system permease protein
MSVPAQMTKPQAQAPVPRPPGKVRPAIRPMAPIVPPGSIAGRALVAVVAIMGFLACLAVGAVTLVTDAAREWQNDVAREVTIQLRPRDGADIERELARAADIARATPGVTGIRVLSRADNERLLRPWLGDDLALDGLPVPRLVLVELGRGRAFDGSALRARLAAELPTATLDDHRPWQDRLAAMTRAVVLVGSGVLVLVLIATALSVVFATRGAMASNRDIVEVLHLVGAEDRFIAETFQRRFLRLGLEGGAIGGLAAVICFHLATALVRLLSGSAGEAQLDLLFGRLAFGWSGYVGILGTVIAVAAVTALTSRLAVSRYLAEHR